MDMHSCKIFLSRAVQFHETTFPFLGESTPSHCDDFHLQSSPSIDITLGHALLILLLIQFSTFDDDTNDHTDNPANNEVVTDHSSNSVEDLVNEIVNVPSSSVSSDSTHDNCAITRNNTLYYAVAIDSTPLKRS